MSDDFDLPKEFSTFFKDAVRSLSVYYLSHTD